MPWMTHDRIFSTHYYAVRACPAQGWKVHVSATPWSAPVVLERSLPVLLAYGAACKVASTRFQLLLLNNGHYGSSQVGKFITVYPSDDAEAVQIAADLHRVTEGLPGPRVPSDMQLRPRSLVHYRYGAFHRPPGRPHGEPQDAVGGLRDRQGRWVPDVRELWNNSPLTDLVDPFEASGARIPAAPRQAPLAGRYIVVDVLATSAYGGIYRALDLDSSPPHPCVLKEFWRDAGGDVHGRLAPDWGRREAGILIRHSNDPVFPTYLGQFELDGNVFVALEYVPGRPVAAELTAREERMDEFSVEEVVTLAGDTARALDHLHSLDIVFRDVNPANLILTPQGTCRLVDFGIAHDHRADLGPPSGLGTADFCSPQQWVGNPPTAGDDIFSWGAVMHLLLCGTRGLQASRDLTAGPPGQPVRRLPVRELEPGAPTWLADLIDRAVAWDPAERCPSFGTVLEALAAAPTQPKSMAPMSRFAGAVLSESIRTERPDDNGPLGFARVIGESLCASALTRDGGACWATRGQGTTFCGPDLYHGAAGIALFLAELSRACQEDKFAATARSAARWLAGPVWANGRAEPGLYCGESGVGWLMLRLAHLLDEPGYLTAAELRARRLRGVRHATLDLLEGAAGHGVFLIRLWQATRNTDYLEDALKIGELLLNAHSGASDGSVWRPPVDAPGQDRVSLGLAHGLAGIAFALLELSEASGNARMASAAVEIGDLLLAKARPHPDGGWRWAETLDGNQSRVQAQCHGAIGIGQFFVRLARLRPDAKYAHGARQAALTAHREMARRSSPALCHGLVSDGMLLLECMRLLDEPRHLDWARECGDHLWHFRDKAQPGRYVPAAGGPSRPDLLTGDAGVGWFYLALASPDRAADPILGWQPSRES
jgi:hypothetical protein